MAFGFDEDWLSTRQREKAIRTRQDAPQRTNAAPVAKRIGSTGRGFDAFLSLLSANGLPMPETEYQFHPTRRFKADYAWPAQKLIIERQGGVWAKAGSRAKKAHTEPMAILRDYEKANLANLAGWCYLQYTPEQLDKGSVIETLKILLAGV